MDQFVVDVGDQQVAPGDAVVLYTDGITEREAPSGEMYDTERLVEGLTESLNTN